MKNERPDTITCPFCGKTFHGDYALSVRMVDRVCMVCGHVWASRKGSVPRRCPSCRSTEWNVSSRNAVECKKCGHSWIPRRGYIPQICPKCKSDRWNGDKPDLKLKWERKVENAVSLYSQGADCVEASVATGVPLEAIILKIRSLGDDPVRMFSKDR